MPDPGTGHHITPFARLSVMTAVLRLHPEHLRADRLCAGNDPPEVWRQARTVVSMRAKLETRAHQGQGPVRSDGVGSESGFEVVMLHSPVVWGVEGSS